MRSTAKAGHLGMQATGLMLGVLFLAALVYGLLALGSGEITGISLTPTPTPSATACIIEGVSQQHCTLIIISKPK